MFSKSHQGIVKKTVVLEFENGYKITLEAGVEMSMHLVMDEAQIKNKKHTCNFILDEDNPVYKSCECGKIKRS